MPPVTVIAKFKAKQGCSEQVKSELYKLLEPTRKEKGCINYDLHEDNNDAGIFFFHENWESNELLDKHLSSEHLRRLGSVLPDIVELAEVHKMTRLS